MKFTFRRIKYFIVSYSYNGGFGMCSISCNIYPTLAYIKEYTNFDDIVIINIMKVSEKEMSLFFGWDKNK